MVGAALLVTALSVLPLAFVMFATAQTGPSMALSMLWRPRVAELLLNSAALMVLALPLALALALALAILTERTDLPGARLWSGALTAPLAVPAFVQGYAWVGTVPNFHGLPAAILLSVLTYFPFVFLPLAAALRRLDPAIEEAASSMGLTPARVLRRVVVPQVRPAALAGSFLVGLHLLAEYGLFAMLRFDTFTTAIMDQFQSAFAAPAANMLATVLVVCCLGLLGADTLLRGKGRYARLGAGAARIPRRIRLGAWAAPALLLPAAVLVLSLGVPGLTLGRWLLAGGTAVWRVDEVGAALAQTVLLAGASGMLAVVAAFPVCWLATRHPGRLERGLEGLNLLAGALPGIVVALALITISVRVIHPLYQTIVTALMAYVLMFLPRALLGLRASLAQVPTELERAATILGRSPGRALLEVTVRLAAPGMATAATLVALGVATELTATQMLAPAGMQTLATAFWAYSSEIDYVAAAPYAVLMIAISAPLTILLYRQSVLASGR